MPLSSDARATNCEAFGSHRAGLDPRKGPVTPSIPPRDVEILEAARVWANESCAPLWWNEPEREHAADRRKVGTVCLVDTGARLIGITAQHVHRQLAARLQNGLTMSCQLGGMTFDPVSCLIDEDSDIDLATYDLSPVAVAASCSREWRAPSWPPPGAEVGMACSLGGYPYQLAADLQVAPSELTPAHRREFKFLCFYVFRVSDRSSRRVVCDVDPENSPSWTNERFPTGALFDGMSGGPLIQFPQTSGITTFSLRAIIVDRAFNQVVCRPLQFVRPDGTLDRSLW